LGSDILGQRVGLRLFGCKAVRKAVEHAKIALACRILLCYTVAKPTEKCSQASSVVTPQH